MRVGLLIRIRLGCGVGKICILFLLIHNIGWIF
nr:MAG TPA: hypothetical protein [Caudoviricetes sp.]